MATTPNSPPPRLRPDVSQTERQLIESVTGPLSDGALRAVRDARGKQFQRLEFLGDSVLDVVMSAHSVVSPDCGACRHVNGNIARLVSDAALTRTAQAHQLGRWLEWNASPERLADLVEACIAAAWVSGGWEQSINTSSNLLHPLGSLGEIFAGRLHMKPVSSKAVRRVGAAFLELAGAAGAFHADPNADEAELSAMRAAVHRADKVAEFVRRSRVVDGNGESGQVSDRVEALIAGLLWEQGADAAFSLADRVLYS